MSLVERALKKIQESRGSVPASERSVAATHPGIAKDPGHLAVARAARDVALHEAPATVAPPKRTIHIDHTALRASHVLPPENQERYFADQYRNIKRPLIDGALGRGPTPVQQGHLIMVASALPGEGKTFSTINLALSMALEKDVSVLLVDADVAKPQVSGIFGLEGERGLLDVLRDESIDVESTVLPTSIPRLSILPAGKRSDTATELLASERMRQIGQQLAARDPNRIVLFDSPPLLLTSESRALASVVGQIVMVVRAGFTPQQAVLEALDLLGDQKPIGMVLNQCDENVRSGYYHEYYGRREEPAQQPAV